MILSKIKYQMLSKNIKLFGKAIFLYTPSFSSKTLGICQIKLANHHAFYFCDKKKFEEAKQSSKHNQQKQNTQSSQKEQNKSKQVKLTQEELLMTIFGLDPGHSFKNDLILAKQQYEKSTKQLKDAILFQDLLKSQIDILIYDTKGKPYYPQLLKLFVILFVVFGSFFSARYSLKHDPKMKVFINKTSEGKFLSYLLLFMCTFLFITSVLRYIRFTRRFVEKIVYNTQDQHFTFTKRRYFGGRYDTKISRFKILYTESPGLVQRGTNYLNLDNYDQYKIGYQFAWKKESLFSHLISQRIGK